MIPVIFDEFIIENRKPRASGDDPGVEYGV